MFYPFQPFIRVGLLCAAACGLPVWALSTDQQQPVQIEADSATLDNIKGTTLYLGNVIVIQGSLRLQADQVTLNYTASKDIDTIIAESRGKNGNPVRFQQQLDSKEEVRAEAQRMEYHAKEDMLHLKDGAQVWKNKDTVTGQHIVYDAKRGQIKADQGRVKVVIESPNAPDKK
jgi:lipopolysaccharide export system protein LptA